MKGRGVRAPDVLPVYYIAWAHLYCRYSILCCALSKDVVHRVSALDGRLGAR